MAAFSCGPGLETGLVPGAVALSLTEVDQVYGSCAYVG
jgi:hypothetical protein